jgi:hypothetical protein
MGKLVIFIKATAQKVASKGKFIQRAIFQNSWLSTYIYTEGCPYFGGQGWGRRRKGGEDNGG